MAALEMMITVGMVPVVSQLFSGSCAERLDHDSYLQSGSVLALGAFLQAR